MPKIAVSAAVKKKSKAQERSLQRRASLWPELKPDDVWNRQIHDGFMTLPRTLPIVMAIIDSLTKNQPAGQTYLSLWFRAWDEMLLVIDNPATLAAETGFNGERAVTTWRARMKALLDLGFIDAKSGPSGQFHYVLLRNPHKVVWPLKDKIQEQLFRLLMDRALEVGAEDFKESTS